ncbi:MAG: UvrD-helicase domain-containing protein [Pseudomonadota bacterium]
MSEQALTDLAARDAALDVQRSCIVQAPAGSGKTGLLTQRLLRLLLIVEQPEQVLAITFTRKAASEMRARVVRALIAARDGVAASNAHEASIVQDAKQVLARSDEREWALIDLPMRLTIMTVDALNAQLTRSRPFEAGNAGAGIVDGGQQKALYGQAADALLDWLSEDDSIGRAATTFFSHLDINASQWRRELIAMLGKRDQWLPRVLAAGALPPDALRAQCETLLGTMVERELLALDALIPQALKAPILAGLGPASAILQTTGDSDVCAVEDWPDCTASDLAQWQMLAKLLTTDAGSLRKRLTVKEGFPPKDKERKEAMMTVLAQLAAMPGCTEAIATVRRLPVARYTDAQWRSIAALLTLLPALAAELSRLMEIQGQLDYPALAAAALSALGDAAQGAVSELALRLDYRLMHILVDEMQDTSVAQYRLLETLTQGWQADDGRTLFCVGDPMQSIYRFRGAEVSLFLKAWDDGIGDVALDRLTLATNFRSNVAIIDWVNSAFTDILGDTNDRNLEQVSYSPSVAPATAGQGGTVQWHAVPDDDEAEAHAVLEQVQRIRAAYPQDSIALLGRTRRVLEAPLASLRQAGINSEAVEMDRLTDLPEIIDVLSLTRALEHPCDDVAWLGLLRAPFLALPLQAIDQLVMQRDLRAHKLTLFDTLLLPEQFATLDDKTRLLVQHFASEFDRAQKRAATHPLHLRVRQLWYRLGGPTTLRDRQALENVMTFFDTLGGLETNGQLDYVATLTEQLDGQKIDRRGDGGVVAMTIYKAKGLEFDHVILPGLEKSSRSDQQQTIYLERDQESEAMLIAARPSRTGAEVDALHQLIARRERQRRNNELRRLMYVAATRARKTLHLFGALSLNSKNELATPRADSLLGVAWSDAEPVFAAAAQGDVQAPAATRQTRMILPMRRALAEPFVSAPSELSLRAQTPTSQATTTVSFDWAGSDARHVGTVVHHWLFRLAGDAHPARSLPGHDRLMQTSRVALRRLGVSGAALDDAAKRVADAVVAGVNSDPGQWLLTNRHADSEAEMTIAVANGDGSARRFIIDRIIRDKDGTLWIVDYKTSLHEGGGIAAFFANEAVRYRDQLQGYRGAVEALFASQGRDCESIKTALFFPAYGHLELVNTDGKRTSS